MSYCYSLVILLLYWSVTLNCVSVLIRIAESVTVYPASQSSVGERAHLPCNITPPTEDDAITLVLWYRSDIKILPIYTVDIRHNREKAKHLSSDALGDRAFFNLSVRPAILTLDPVQDNDGGEYRCRVDFRWGRTLSSTTHLNVIVPPKQVYIKDEKDQQVFGLIGPIEEGSNVKLTCIAKGGKPTPSVHWYRDNVLIDSTTSSMVDDSIIGNELIIENIRRSDLKSIFSCQAINNNSTPPLTTSVRFDIYVKPSDVKIISIKRPLSAGRKFDLICRSRGSRPPAQLTWLKDNRLLSHTRESFTEDGNVTTSVLEFVPSAEDHGSYLICRAENLRLANSSIADEWLLNIFFEPKASLSLKPNSQPNGLITEGSQALMECQIRANPSVVEVKWFFNGKPLIQDTDKALFIRNASLELRSTRREHQGLYQCVSSNLEGKGESNELQLDVHFAPICRKNQLNNSIGIALGETIELQCVVDASPTHVTFYWTFNDFRLEGDIKSSSDGLRSILKYKAASKDDIGKIGCWAKNDVGPQKHACIFNLVSAGPPESVHECKLRNRTVSSFLVECLAGYDGGLEQTFYLEIIDAESKKSLTNITNRDRPEFEATGLQAGTQFYVNIYSANAKGSSAYKNLTTATIAMSSSSNAENEEALKMLLDLSPLFGVFVGFLTAIILVTIIIILICKINRRNNAHQTDASNKRSTDGINLRLKHNKCNQSLKDSGDLSNESNETTKSPDIIPPSSVEFTEYGHSSAIQCLNTNWESIPNSVSITYSNGSIHNMPPYEKKCSSLLFDGSATPISHTYDKNLCKTVDIINNSQYPKYPDYYYNTLPQTNICETLEPVIDYSLTTNRNETRKPAFRALSTPV